MMNRVAAKGLNKCCVSVFSFKWSSLLLPCVHLESTVKGEHILNTLFAV